MFWRALLFSSGQRKLIEKPTAEGLTSGDTLAVGTAPLPRGAVAICLAIRADRHALPMEAAANNPLAAAYDLGAFEFDICDAASPIPAAPTAVPASDQPVRPGFTRLAAMIMPANPAWTNELTS